MQPSSIESFKLQHIAQSARMLHTSELNVREGDIAFSSYSTINSA